jgi:NADH-quinone oxidoreductase subunit N
MEQEIGLVILFVFLLLYDTFCSEKGKHYFQGVACVLFACHTVLGFFPITTGEVFGGIYISTPLTVFMKNILNVGTLLVFLQSKSWLSSLDTVHRKGEFFTILLVTLLGMYIMVSAGNFMMLYIGMETASLPLACLAAFNKYREKSAEAGVKYILISALSSGIMLFGLSFLYGGLGSFYFSDMAANGSLSFFVILCFLFLF